MGSFGLRRWHLITGLSLLAFEATLSRGKVVSPALFAYPIPCSETSRARTAGVRTHLARDGREPIATLAIPARFRSFTFETTLARRKVVRATTRARPIPGSAHARALRGRAVSCGASAALTERGEGRTQSPSDGGSWRDAERAVMNDDGVRDALRVVGHVEDGARRGAADR